MLCCTLQTLLLTMVTRHYWYSLFLQADIENKIRQRVDLQETRRQQLHYKELKRQAELEEEEEFRRQVCFIRLKPIHPSTSHYTT